MAWHCFRKLEGGLFSSMLLLSLLSLCLCLSPLLWKEGGKWGRGRWGSDCFICLSPRLPSRPLYLSLSYTFSLTLHTVSHCVPCPSWTIPISPISFTIIACCPIKCYSVIVISRLPLILISISLTHIPQLILSLSGPDLYSLSDLSHLSHPLWGSLELSLLCLCCK